MSDFKAMTPDNTQGAYFYSIQGVIKPEDKPLDKISAIRLFREGTWHIGFICSPFLLMVSQHPTIFSEGPITNDLVMGI